MSQEEATAYCAQVSADVYVVLFVCLFVRLLFVYPFANVCSCQRFQIITHIGEVDARSATSVTVLREALQS
jgi:hypothetical protein